MEAPRQHSAPPIKEEGIPSTLHRSGDVYALACTPDSTMLASSDETDVRIWSLASNTCIAELRGHSGRVCALACTPDSATLASGGEDKTVRLWRLAHFRHIAPHIVTPIICDYDSDVLRGHTSYVATLACTPDGATLASGSADNTVRLWRLADNTCTAVLEGHTNWVRALACTPDGATLASGSGDNTVRLWSLVDNTCTAILEGHTNWVRALACTPDGATLASGSGDNTVRLWRLADKTCTAVLEGHTHYVKALACMPDSATLASGSDDNTVRLWRLADNTCIAVLRRNSPVYALACTLDGATLAASYSSFIRLWHRPLLSALACDFKSLASLSTDSLDGSDLLHQLIHASPSRHESLPLLLRRAPACALVKNKNGCLPLHIAIYEKDLDAVVLLLRHSPGSVLIKDDKGRLPFDLAVELKYLDAVRLLRRPTDLQRLLALGSRPLAALKLFLCGDSRAGKTTIARTLRNARHDPGLNRTAGIDVKRAAFTLRSGTSITLSLHDFAGHHQFHAMHELILAEPNAVFAVLVDASRPATEQRRHLLYWLRLIATRVSQAQQLTAQTETRPTVVVIGTHADGPAASGDVLRSALGDALASLSGWSALLDIRAEDFALIACQSNKAVVDALQAPLERAWKAMSGGSFKAPTLLDKLGPMLSRLGTGQPLWTLDNLAETLRHVTVTTWYGRRDAKTSAAIQSMQGDVLAATLRFLHAEGVVVWFDQDERLATYVVLQPSWLYHEVVGPALAPPTKEFAGRSLHLRADSAGVVTASLFKAYYESRGINPIFCLAVMHAFALYYESAGAPGQPSYFVFPAVLEESMPAGAWPVHAGLQCAARRIILAQPELNILPPGLLPRLQVKLAATGDAMLGTGTLIIWKNALVWKNEALHLLVQLRDAVLGCGIDTSVVEIVVRFLDGAAGRRALSLVMDFAREHCEGLDTKEMVLSSAWLRDGGTLVDAPELPMDRAEGSKPDMQLLFESGSCETAASLLLGPATVKPSSVVTSASPPVFISLRFAEAQSEACALQAALRNRGAEAFVCDELPGGNLKQNIVDALYGCSLVVILGTQTYGRKTASSFSSYEELRFVIDQKKAFFLVKMCDEFKEPITLFDLPGDVAYFPWQPSSMEERTSVPPEMVNQIMARLGR